MAYDPTLKARPTVYKGIRMRSRLEANFAGALDVFKQRHLEAGERYEWAYEPECFADETRQYLPDFRVTTDKGTVYYELKGYLEDSTEVRHLMEVIWLSEPDAALVLMCQDGAGDWVGEHGTWGPHAWRRGNGR